MTLLVLRNPQARARQRIALLPNVLPALEPRFGQQPRGGDVKQAALERVRLRVDGRLELGELPPLDEPHELQWRAAELAGKIAVPARSEQCVAPGCIAGVEKFLHRL